MLLEWLSGCGCKLLGKVHKSLPWADAVSTVLRACSADKVTTSAADLVPKSWTKKSIAEAVLKFEISMTLSP